MNFDLLLRMYSRNEVQIEVRFFGRLIYRRQFDLMELLPLSKKLEILDITPLRINIMK